MSFWNLFIYGGVLAFFLSMAKGLMFDDQYARLFVDWFDGSLTKTASREGWTRALCILGTSALILLFLGKFTGAGDEYSSAWWEPSAAILAVLALHLWWWTTGGRFARQWKEWNCDTKRDTATK